MTLLEQSFAAHNALQDLYRAADHAPDEVRDLVRDCLHRALRQSAEAGTMIAEHYARTGQAIEVPACETCGGHGRVTMATADYAIGAACPGCAS